MSIEEIYDKGISDMVETEGDLRRFTKICQEFHQGNLYSWDEIIPLVKKVTGFTHPSPIQRHIAIFKNLGILDQKDSAYTLSSEGRAILELVKNESLGERLTLPEKIFYFKAFFSNALYQLFILLKTIGQKKESSGQEEVIVDYFRRIINSPFRVWQKESLRRDIEIYESRGHVQKGLQNKFGCMKAWLRYLELLKDRKELVLTSLGKEVLKDLEENSLATEDHIFAIANVYVTGRVNSLPPFDCYENKHRHTFLDLFDMAYSLFETQELSVSDAKSIRCFVCIKMLQDHHITLEEKVFDGMVNDLARGHIVNSLITGRDGRLAYISRFPRDSAK